MQQRKILILGVGNTLLGDEGFGVHAVRLLEQKYIWPENVRLVDGGTLGLLLLGELLECDLVIILDIARGGSLPGTFYKLDGADMSRGLSMPQSMHQTSIEDVLISCDLAGHRPEAIAYAMEPFNYADYAPMLTRQASEALPAFCNLVVSELGKMGINASPK